VLLLRQAWVMRADQSGWSYDLLEAPTELTVAQLQENVALPESISFWKLPPFIKFFEDSGFSALKHRVYWHSLLAAPFFMMALVIVAATFSLTPNQRQGGAAKRVLGSILAGFSIYFFAKVAYAFGVSSNLPILLAVWMPIVIFSMFSGAVLLHTEDG
jgi:lipopolysaccharide export system permease protein